MQDYKITQAGIDAIKKAREHTAEALAYYDEAIRQIEDEDSRVERDRKRRDPIQHHPV